jgi:hypothetical protein
MDIQGWTGRILKLWSTGSGDGMVSIGVNDYLAVRSYSYAIKLSSPIHSVISSLKEDDTVSFSGQILTKKEDCFQTIMSSAMTKLDLDFFFSDIRSRQPTPADIRARQERIAKQIFANDCLDIARIIKEIGDRTLAQIVYDRCHDQMENGSWRETPNGRGALEKVERQ